MFNKARFKAALALKEMSSKELADRIGINEATLYRKMNGASDFTRGEIQKIFTVLDIDSPEQIKDIFFSD